MALMTAAQVMLVLVGLVSHVPRAARGQQCFPQDLGENLRLAFHGTTHAGVCHHQSPVIDDAKMVEFCHAFCTTGGSMTGLPMLLGAAQYGFNLDQMMDVCSEIAEDSSTLRGFCSGRREALARIKDKAAELVASVAVVKAEETAFRAAVLQNAADLGADLVSREFKDEVDKAPRVEKIELLRSKIVNFTMQLVNDGGAVENMLDGLAHLKNLSVQLNQTFSTYLPQFQEFVTQCNQILLGVGSELEALLDICPQGSDECVEASTARHVGCCCGLNPVVAPTLTIDGLNASLFEGLGSVSRRLQSSTVEPETNICAQAKRLSEKGVEEARGRTISFGGGKLLEQEDQLLLTKYPNYYDQCPVAKRRLEKVDDTTASVASFEWSGSASSTSANTLKARKDESNMPFLHSVGTAQLRGLQSSHDHVACIPPIVSNDLKVAFSNTTEPDTCYLQDPEVRNMHMQGQCEAFCAGHNSVPLLIGTEWYGFNLSEANSICLPPNGVLVHDPQKLRDCKARSFGFQEIDVKTAQLTAQLEVFTHVQLLYVAQLRNVSNDILEYITSDIFTDEMRRVRDKVGYFKAAINAKVEAFRSSAVSFALENAIELLRRLAQLLYETLERNIVLIQEYLSECNELHVGTGPYEEYLLDICGQHSVGCIEEEAAGHVSCCCAFHPFTAFGQTVPQATINGIRDFAPPARVSAGRLLQEAAEAASEEDRSVMDICAQVWTDARDSVSQLLTCTEETGQADVSKQYQEEMTDLYGKSYCGYEGYRNHTLPQCAVVSSAGTTTTTPTTTPTTTTSTAVGSATNTSTTEECIRCLSSWAAPHFLLVAVLLALW